MPATTRSIRRLPDGTLLRNRLLAALPRADYDRIALVEVATVGHEGMLGIGVFFGDRAGIGP